MGMARRSNVLVDQFYAKKLLSVIRLDERLSIAVMGRSAFFN